MRKLQAENSRLKDSILWIEGQLEAHLKSRGEFGDIPSAIREKTSSVNEVMNTIFKSARTGPAK